MLSLVLGPWQIEKSFFMETRKPSLPWFLIGFPHWFLIDARAGRAPHGLSQVSFFPWAHVLAHLGRGLSSWNSWQGNIKFLLYAVFRQLESYSFRRARNRHGGHPMASPEIAPSWVAFLLRRKGEFGIDMGAPHGLSRNRAKSNRIPFSSKRRVRNRHGGTP